MELNFFDLKPLGSILKYLPFWVRTLNVLCKSKCSLKRQNRTKTIVAIRITIRVIEIEHTGIRAIIVIASTNEERIARIHKVRVVTV